MRALFLRTVTFLVGVLLVPPPGWCCMAPFRACAEEVGNGDAQQPRPCCQHADGASKPSPRAPQPAPPLPLGKCPCSQHAFSTDAPKAVGSDLALAAPPLLIDSVTFPVAAGSVAKVPLQTFDHSLRLLHCVWLC